MAGRTTTITSKWLIGGEGSLKDLFEVSPSTKLSIDFLTYLFRHPAYVVIPAAGIYGFLSAPTPPLEQFTSLDTLPTRIAASIIAALLAAYLIMGLKYLKISLTDGLNRRHYHKTSIKEIPLDKHESRAASVNLDRSILIGGESGSGKSNLIWRLLQAANTYGIPYRLHVVDPAGGVELQDLTQSPFLVNYVDRAQHADALIIDMRNGMDQRLAEMKQRNQRKHVATPDSPKHILIIDELLLLSTQIKQGVSSPLGELLAVGRKAGYIVIAASQLGQVDTIGRIRDLFPQRICFATRTDDMTDAILGTGATRDGAACHLLTRPGEGYCFTESPTTHSKYFQYFRAPLIENHQTPMIANPLLPPALTHEQTQLLNNRKTALYRLYANDPSHTCLYVGISDKPNKRFKQHQENQGWYAGVDHSRTNITWYPNRGKALEAEAQEIKRLRPVYNIQHNQSTTT